MALSYFGNITNTADSKAINIYWLFDVSGARRDIPHPLRIHETKQGFEGCIIGAHTKLRTERCLRGYDRDIMSSLWS